MVSVVFRLVRSWLFCNSGFWLRLFVTRFWLADVGWDVRCSSTWSVLLSVVLRREIFCGPLDRIQAAAASCAHVSCSGGQEPVAWVQMQLTRNRHLLVFSK